MSKTYFIVRSSFVFAFTIFALAACTGAPATVEPSASAQQLNYPTIQPPNNPTSQLPACPSDINAPLFNTIPVDPKDFIAFRPLGFLSPPIHMFPAKHSNFSMTLPGQTPSPKPVRAPGKVWVVEIWEATFSTGGKNYQVYLYPCREVRVYFGHIVSVSERLLTEFKKAAPRCNSFNDGTATVTTCRRENMMIPLDAGERFGTGPDTAGIDYGANDTRLRPAAFINVEHYSHDYPYYVSPVNYYTPEVKKIFDSKIGNVFGNRARTAEPIAGLYMQDIPGTAQGNWFFPGKYHRNSTDLSSALGLAHDYVDPTQPMMAIGNSINGLRMGLYSFTPQGSGKINRDFSAVKSDGAIYCYDNFTQGQSAGGMGLGKPNGIILLTMPSDTTLKIELKSGSKSDAAVAYSLTANAAVFER